MKASPPLKFPHPSLLFSKVLLLTAIAWTVLVSGMLVWHMFDTKRHIEHVAREAALENIEKDILYRSWAAEHGGVYVTVTEKTPPNPYLSHLKERDIATPSGRKLTLVNPAYMTRQIHERKRMQSGILQHITSRKPLRPENRPDEWERKALDVIADGRKEFGEVTMLDGAPYYRLMMPQYIEESCLKCHATQGYKLGDLRGGISASLPMSMFENVSKRHILSEAGHFGTAWLVGLAGMLLVRPYVNRRVREGERAEQLLRESEERYRTIVSTAHEGIISIDEQLNITFVNPSMLRMLGYTKGEMFGRPFFLFIHEDEVEDHKKQIELRKKGHSSQYERRFRRKDGSVVWTLAAATPLWDERRKFRGAFGLYTDITERKKAEKELRTSKEDWEVSFNAIHDAITIHDKDFNIVRANHAAEQILSMPALTILGQKCFASYHGSEAPPACCPSCQVLQTGEASCVEVFEPHLGKYLDIKAFPRTDASGTLIGLVHVVRDITGRKRMENALKASENRFRSLVEDAPISFTIISRDGRIEYVNRKFVRILGYALEDVPTLERWWTLAYPDPQEREAVAREWNAIAESSRSGIPEHRKLERRVSCKYGSFKDVEINVTPVGQKLFVVIYDVTERKRTEETLQSAKEYAENLIQTANTIVVGLDAEGGITVFNEAAQKITGYTLAELQGRSWFETLVPKDRYPQVWAEFVRLTSGGLPKVFENTILTKSGEERYIVWQNNEVYEQGRITGAISFGMDITDRKKAEEELRRHRETLAKAQRVAEFGIWEWDIGTNRLTWNNEVYDLYGLDPASGMPTYDTVINTLTPDCREAFMEAVRRALEEGAHFEGEYSILRPDGEVRYTHTIGEVTRDARGRPIGMFGIVQNITTRRKAEQALRESEERFRVLFRDAPDAIFLAEPQTGIIADANVAAEQLMQLSREDLVGLHQSKLHPAEQESEIRQLFASYAGSEVSGLSEAAVIRKDGTQIPVHIGAKVIFLGGKRYLMGIFRDIREIKRMEGVLKDHVRRLEEAQRIARYGEYVFSPATGQWECSKGLEEVFGIMNLSFRRDEDGWLRIVHPEDREEMGRYLREYVLRDRNPFDREYRIVRINDQEVRWVHGRGALTIGPAGTVSAMFGMIQDITERKLAEEHRSRLEQQLLQAQKIETVGRLAGGVAHDINNMLMPILGYAEMLHHHCSENDSCREDIEAIIRSTERVRDITRQLLAFARKQTLEMRTVDLNKVIEGFGKILRRTLREDIIVETNIAPSPCLMRGDPGQIEQVVLNLAVNAQDAMPGDGVLGIKTSRVYIDEAFVHAHQGAAPGVHIMLEVIDTGTGMSEEIRSRIFEPFFTTKEVGRGTGLGLAMVYGIVKQHGGYIDVQSEGGKGSTFIVYFPAWKQQDAQDEGNAAEVRMPGGTETLLVVEDQEDVLSVVARMLEEGGYRVLRAINADEAVKAAASHRGQIDLLLTDVIMPGMNGKDLYEALARSRKGLRVLYMSGYPADVISTHGVLHSGTNFIRKPCSLRDLLVKVREVLEG